MPICGSSLSESSRSELIDGHREIDAGAIMCHTIAILGLNADA